MEDEAASPRGSLVRRDYLRTVIDYAHLNPGRAELVDGAEKSVLDFPWSSVAKGFALALSKRPKWLAAKLVLDPCGKDDTVAGQRRFVERLDGFVRSERSDPQEGEVPLSKPFERGWFRGSQDFRERLLKRIEKLDSKKSRKYRSRSESPAKDHGKKRALEILAESCAHYGMSMGELQTIPLGDWKRASVAWALARETSVPHAWIAERLNLKSAANASQQVRRFQSLPIRRLAGEVKQWKLSRNVACPEWHCIKRRRGSVSGGGVLERRSGGR